MLLGVISVGMVWLALFVLAFATFESSSSPDLKEVAALPFLGLLGLLGAAVGRALARWLLAAFGVLLVVGVGALAWAPLSTGEGFGWLESTLVVLAGVGVLALVMAWRQWRRIRSGPPARRAN